MPKLLFYVSGNIFTDMSNRWPQWAEIRASRSLRVILVKGHPQSHNKSRVSKNVPNTEMDPRPLGGIFVTGSEHKLLKDLSSTSPCNRVRDSSCPFIPLPHPLAIAIPPPYLSESCFLHQRTCFACAICVCF